MLVHSPQLGATGHEKQQHWTAATLITVLYSGWSSWTAVHHGPSWRIRLTRTYSFGNCILDWWRSSVGGPLQPPHFCGMFAVFVWNVSVSRGGCNDWRRCMEVLFEFASICIIWSIVYVCLRNIVLLLKLLCLDCFSFTSSWEGSPLKGLDGNIRKITIDVETPSGPELVSQAAVHIGSASCLRPSWGHILPISPKSHLQENLKNMGF